MKASQRSFFAHGATRYLLVSVMAMASLALANEETPEARGLAIMQQAKAANEGWVSSTAEMTMVLRNKRGDESRRSMMTKSLEVQGDGDKSLTVFNQPRDIDGTAFLSFSHVLEADEQWLYLPALKRVKRIASQNKSGPFMGSEFAYEDLSSFEVEKFNYRYLQTEACGSEQCYVVESYPVDKFSGYSKQVIWIDFPEYRIHKVEFYDKFKKHRKTLSLSDYQQYEEKFWRPKTQKMTNHMNGKSTDIYMNNIQFKTGLSDADFNRNALKRAR